MTELWEFLHGQYGRHPAYMAWSIPYDDAENYPPLFVILANAEPLHVTLKQ